MTTGGDSLFVTVGGRDIGLAALLQRVDKEMAKSGDSAVRLGQSYARLAVAQGRPALAAQVLAGTMQHAGGATERALIGIQTQAARTNTGLAVLPRTLAGLSHEAASMATGMLGLGAALGVAKAGVDSFAAANDMKIQLDATTKSINQQLDGVRNTSRVWAEATEFANKYKLTQAETNAILQNSIGVLRTSSASVGDLEAALLRLQSRDVSKPISEAARALRELNSGDVTTIKEVFNIGAADALRMKNEIQAGGDAVQVLSAFLDTAGNGMEVLANRAEGAQGNLNDAAVAAEKLALAQAKFSEGPGLAFTDFKTNILKEVTAILSGDFAEIEARNAQRVAAQEAYNAALAAGKTEAEAYAAAQVILSQSTQQSALVTAGAADTMEAYRQIENATATAIAEATAATQTEATALIDDITKKQQAQIESAQLAAVQQTLANLGAAVAGGLQTASSAAAAMAAQYNISTAAALALIQAQAALGQAKVNASALSDQRAGERDAGSGRTAAQITFAADQDRKAQASRLRRAEEAERALKKIRGGGGGGGGGPKLSDQQKLNNQLLASQETFSTKAEDAEIAHLDRILEINADFAEKMKDAQEDFAQSQLEGRAGFYDTLGSIEDAGLRQALSAQYEAAFAEADKIAQERGADVGEKFLEAKQAAIEAQGKRASEIAAATKEGDKDKAEYLAGVDKLYREAEERKIAAIASGEGSIAAQRDKQLAEEALQYAGKQAEIGDAADTAAARKILAAERAGKSVDAEGLKVDGLITKYNELGAAGARAGVVPSPSGVSPSTAAPVTPTGTPAVPGDTIAAAIASLREGLAAIERATNASADKVAGAVRSSAKFAS